jgi:hypothetical protein
MSVFENMARSEFIWGDQMSRTCEMYGKEGNACRFGVGSPE